MELGKNWGKVDPSQHAAFERLGPREQGAARKALSGIAEWQQTHTEPKRMRVQISPDRPFNMKEFLGFMHVLGVGVAESIQREKDGAYTLQPRPYSETFLPQTERSKIDALYETIDEQIAAIPREIREMMGDYDRLREEDRYK